MKASALIDVDVGTAMRICFQDRRKYIHVGFGKIIHDFYAPENKFSWQSRLAISSLRDENRIADR
jgi:hypothetical protein